MANRYSTRIWLSYVPDVALTAIVLVLVVGGSCLIRWVEYLGGLHGAGVGQSFVSALGLKPLIGFITLVVIVPMAVIRLLLRRHPPGHILLRLTFPSVCLVALFIPIETPGPMAAVYLQGFERRMLKKVDIDAVQQWLATNGVRYAGQEYRYSFPPELPGCLTECHPELILFSDATLEHDVTIEFRWYAPHGENYGLIVGSPSMKTPEQGVIQRPDSSFNEFRRPIKPGVYVFARG